MPSHMIEGDLPGADDLEQTARPARMVVAVAGREAAAPERLSLNSQGATADDEGPVATGRKPATTGRQPIWAPGRLVGGIRADRPALMLPYCVRKG